MAGDSSDKSSRSRSDADPGGHGPQGDRTFASANSPGISNQTSGETSGEASGGASGGGVEVAPGVHLPATALRFSFSRSSGPGGQNVNKVSSKARLEVDGQALEAVLGRIFFRRLLQAAGPSHVNEQGVLYITCDDSRSQIANRQTCMARLRQWVLEAKKPRKTRRKTKPTRASKQRRLDAKKRQGQRKAQRRQPDA